LILQTGNTNAATLSYRAAALPASAAPYYWRVQTKAVNGPSAWSEVRSFTPANPPGIPALSVPAHNGLVTDFTPTLSWAKVAVPAGTLFDHYELQAATNSSFTALAFPQQDLPGLTTLSYVPPDDLTPNTTHYWRVRSVNVDGQYSQWSAVRIFRTAVAPADLLDPPYGDPVDQTLPTFDWSDVSGATGYTFQLSASASFTTALINVSTSAASSQYTPTSPLPGGVDLYWRVQTKAVNGPSAWSQVFVFTSAYPPGIPSLVSPANGTLVYDYTPILNWATVWVPASWPFHHYQIQIDTETSFDAPLEADVFVHVNPSYTPVSDLDPNTPYYWRVRSYNIFGQFSQWSSVRSFRTALPAPGLLTPPDDSTTTDTTPTLDWGEVTGATGFDVQITTDSSWATGVITTSTAASTYTPGTALPVGPVIYWRVRTRGANGPSYWSEVWRITITP
jgi:hypothetical protein